MRRLAVTTAGSNCWGHRSPYAARFCGGCLNLLVRGTYISGQRGKGDINRDINWHLRVIYTVSGHWDITTEMCFIRTVSKHRIKCKEWYAVSSQPLCPPQADTKAICLWQIASTALRRSGDHSHNFAVGKVMTTLCRNAADHSLLTSAQPKLGDHSCVLAAL